MMEQNSLWCENGKSVLCVGIIGFFKIEKNWKKKKKIESSYLYRYFYKIDLRENLIKFERREEKK